MLEQSIDKLTAAVEALTARLDQLQAATPTTPTTPTTPKPARAKAAEPAPVAEPTPAEPPIPEPAPAAVTMPLKALQQRIMRAWPDHAKRSRIQAAMAAFNLAKLDGIPGDVYEPFVARLREEGLLDG